MNIKYEHLGIVVAVFFAVSGLWFWIGVLTPYHDSFTIECTNSGEYTYPLGVDYWCETKNGDDSFFVKRMPSDNTVIDLWTEKAPTQTRKEI